MLFRSANLSREFKIPDWNDTTEIRSRKGNVMRDSVVARAIFSGSLMNPGAINAISDGMKISAMITNIIRKNINTEIACPANIIDFSLPSAMSLCDNMGTNAVVKAPSANKLRKRFGSLNATRNASETKPAPR